jgi:hypothetical protein
MIVVHEDSEFVVITQPDHARLSAEILSLWLDDGLPDHPRRQELLFAVREHDNGWREADAAPRYDAIAQRPHDFRSIPSTDHVEIWQRGIERFSESHPHAALLIALHAESLYGKATEVPEDWHKYFSRLEALREDWFERAGVNPKLIEEDYRFLETADLLSLAICNHWNGPLETALVSASIAESTLHLSPFPLAGATTLQIPFRRIPDRPYQGDADLGGELATATWGERAIRISPEPIASRIEP